VLHAVFPQGPREFIRERKRLVYFPALARRIPELRRHLFFWRFFLTGRSASFDLALIAIAATAVLRSPLPLTGITPYLWKLARGARRGGKKRLLPVALVDLCADGIALVWLVRGSLAYRTPLV
jgi:hypothetical protein